LTLIGPDVDRVVGTGELPPAEHSHRPIIIDGIQARAVRTDSGIDLLCLAAETETLRFALAGRGAIHVSEEAAECVRIERGRPLYGVDLDETVIPQEAGLNERAVSFTKGCYVGQETVARLHYRGKPNRHLRGLRLSAPYSPGTELLLGDRTVGRLTSVVESPRFGPIGLALVRREAGPGVVLVPKGEDGTAEVVALPFAPEA
jgi:folate-binding protein YgfZ